MSSLILGTKSDLVSQQSPNPVATFIPNSLSNSSSGSTLIWNDDTDQVNVTSATVKLGGSTLAIPSNVPKYVDIISNILHKFSYNASATILANTNVTVNFAVNSTERIISITTNNTGKTIYFQTFKVDFTDINSTFNVSIVQDTPNSATVFVNKWYSSGTTIIAIDPTIALTNAATNNGMPWLPYVYNASGTLFVFSENSTSGTTFFFGTSSDDGATFTSRTFFNNATSGNRGGSVTWDNYTNTFEGVIEAGSDANCQIANLSATTVGGNYIVSGKNSTTFGLATPTACWLGIKNAVSLNGGTEVVVGTGYNNVGGAGLNVIVVFNSTFTNGGLVWMPTNTSSVTDNSIYVFKVNSTTAMLLYPAGTAREDIATQMPLNGTFYTNGGKISATEETLVNNYTVGIYNYPVVTNNGSYIIPYMNRSDNSSYIVIRNNYNQYSTVKTPFSKSANLDSIQYEINQTFFYDNSTDTFYGLEINKTGIFAANYTFGAGWGVTYIVSTGNANPTQTQINAAPLVSRNSTHYYIPTVWLDGSSIYYQSVILGTVGVLPNPWMGETLNNTYQNTTLINAGNATYNYGNVSMEANITATAGTTIDTVVFQVGGNITTTNFTTKSGFFRVANKTAPDGIYYLNLTASALPAGNYWRVTYANTSTGLQNQTINYTFSVLKSSVITGTNATANQSVTSGTATTVQAWNLTDTNKVFGGDDLLFTFSRSGGNPVTSPPYLITETLGVGTTVYNFGTQASAFYQNYSTTTIINQTQIDVSSGGSGSQGNGGSGGITIINNSTSPEQSIITAPSLGPFGQGLVFFIFATLGFVYLVNKKNKKKTGHKRTLI